MIFSDWLKIWLETYKKPYIKKNSYERLCYCLRYIPSDFLSKDIANITALELDKIISTCKLSRTRKYLYFALKNCFKRAYCIDLIKNNIADKINPVKHKQKNGTALNKTEQEKFIKDIEKSKYKNLFLFYLFTGCRRCEALSLKWEDIDYIGKIILIKGTKTDKSNRQFFLTEELEKILNDQKTKTQGDLVFPYNQTNITHSFKKLCPNHHLHDLRHTFITRCAESGINISVCQKLVGHSDITTTLKIYTHITNEFERREFTKFNINV